MLRQQHSSMYKQDWSCVVLGGRQVQISTRASSESFSVFIVVAAAVTLSCSQLTVIYTQQHSAQPGPFYLPGSEGRGTRSALSIFFFFF